MGLFNRNNEEAHYFLHESSLHKTEHDIFHSTYQKFSQTHLISSPIFPTLTVKGRIQCVGFMVSFKVDAFMIPREACPFILTHSFYIVGIII